MNEQREAFNIRVPACRNNIVTRLTSKTSDRPYWTAWLVKIVLKDTRNRECEQNLPRNQHCEAVITAMVSEDE